MGACLLVGIGAHGQGCQVLPAIVAVAILELAANSESSRMCQASKVPLVTHLLMQYCQLSHPRHADSILWYILKILFAYSVGESVDIFKSCFYQTS